MMAVDSKSQPFRNRSLAKFVPRLHAPSAHWHPSPKTAFQRTTTAWRLRPMRVEASQKNSRDHRLPCPDCHSISPGCHDAGCASRGGHTRAISADFSPTSRLRAASLDKSCRRITRAGIQECRLPNQLRGRRYPGGLCDNEMKEPMLPAAEPERAGCVEVVTFVGSQSPNAAACWSGLGLQHPASCS
jgi:hypothetical protein